MWVSDKGAVLTLLYMALKALTFLQGVLEVTSLKQSHFIEIPPSRNLPTISSWLEETAATHAQRVCPVPASGGGATHAHHKPPCIVRHLRCASTMLFSFQPQTCVVAAGTSLVFSEKILQFKIVFFLALYQKGKSSRIRFCFRNKVRFRGRNKQSLGIAKVCSLSVKLLKCSCALMSLNVWIVSVGEMT